MARILVLHGPNLNLLGTREPGIYGATRLADIDARLAERAAADGHALETFQSNAEHALIDRIHAAASEGIEFVIINPAGFTHTSVALRDALLGTAIPFIEVHISNVHRREPFRHRSYFSDAAVGTIVGLGPLGLGRGGRSPLGPSSHRWRVRRAARCRDRPGHRRSGRSRRAARRPARRGAGPGVVRGAVSTSSANATRGRPRRGSPAAACRAPAPAS